MVDVEKTWSNAQGIFIEEYKGGNYCVSIEELKSRWQYDEEENWISSYNVKDKEDWVSVPARFVLYSGLFSVDAHVRSLDELRAVLIEATPNEIDQIAVELKSIMEFALEAGYETA